MRSVDDLPFAELPPRRYPAPIEARRAKGALDMLNLNAGGSVLDLAAGRGGLLLDALARSEGQGLGLVADAKALHAAREAATREGLEGHAEFAVATSVEFTTERRFDAIVSIRPMAPSTIVPELDAGRALGWLAPGATLLVGEPFFRRAPSRSYRALLGAAASGLATAGATARSIVAQGYELLSTALLSETEWDAHASLSFRELLDFAAGCPDERVARELRELAEARYHAYWDLGRDTLGFALHAFRRARGLKVVARR